MFKFLLIFSLAGLVVSFPKNERKTLRQSLMDLNKQIYNVESTSLTSKGVQTEFYEQKLDHFSPTDTRTWKQKYFTNDEYYKEGGPVFLMIGGEAAISIGYMTGLAWVEYAKQVNAMLIHLEHRYYGNSRPLPDLSLENMKYLSSSQALEDLATFIADMKTSMNLESNKWISFGGSYPGSLSFWLRAKYPHSIDGAVASSGPVKAKVDFFEYLGVVDNDLKGQFTPGTKSVKYLWDMGKKSSIIRKLIKKPFLTQLIFVKTLKAALMTHPSFTFLTFWSNQIRYYLNNLWTFHQNVLIIQGVHFRTLLLLYPFLIRIIWSNAQKSKLL